MMGKVRGKGHQGRRNGTGRESSRSAESSIGRGSGRDRRHSRGASWGGYLPESAVFAAVFTVLLGISVYMSTGKVEWKLLAAAFLIMAAAGTLILGGIGRSVKKKLEDMDTRELDEEPDEASDEEQDYGK